MISWPLLVYFHFFRFDFLQMIYSNYVWQIWSIVYFDNNKRKYFVFHVSIGNFNSIEIYVIIFWLRESFEAQISHTVSQNRLKQKSVCDFFLNFSFKFNFTLKKRMRQYEQSKSLCHKKLIKKMKEKPSIILFAYLWHVFSEIIRQFGRKKKLLLKKLNRMAYAKESLYYRCNVLGSFALIKYQIISN